MTKSSLYAFASMLVAGIVGFQAVWLPTIGKIICIVIAVVFAFLGGREYRRERSESSHE